MRYIRFSKCISIVLAIAFLTSVFLPVVSEARSNRLFQYEGTSPQESADSGAKSSDGTLSDIDFSKGEEIKPISLEEFSALQEKQPAPDPEELKQYILDNGAGTMEFYFDPVRYKDADGKWREIDIKIQRKQDGKQDKFVSANSDVVVEFGGSETLKSLVKMQKGKYSLEYMPIGADGKLKSVASAAFESTDGKGGVVKDSKFNSEKEYTSLSYSQAFDANTDIRLIPTGKGVREDIILKAPPTQDSFSFAMKLGGMVPVLREDYNTYLVDPKSKEIIGVIPAPYMRDSSLEQTESYLIGVSILKIEEGLYVFTLTPDRDWLNNKERVYPVIIDPDPILHRGMPDTFVSSLTNYKTRNYSSDAALKLGHSATFDVSRGYIDMNAAIWAIYDTLYNNNITPLSATFSAYQDYDGASSPVMDLVKVNSYVNISTVNWNTQPNITGAPIIQGVTVSAIKWYDWNVLSTINEWVALCRQDVEKGIARSYTKPWTWCLKINNEGASHYKRFRAAEYSTAVTYKPKITITYDNLLPAPASVTVTSAKTGSITNLNISFLAVTGATNYKVEVYENTTLIETKIVSSLSMKSVSVSENKNYTVYVSTGKTVAAGDVRYGPKISKPYSVPDTTPPSAPGSVSVSPSIWTKNSSFTVSHDASTDSSGIKEYQFAINQSNTQQPASSEYATFSNASSATSHAITLTKPTGEYFIWVRAVDKASPTNNYGTPSVSGQSIKIDVNQPVINNLGVLNRDPSNEKLRISADFIDEAANAPKDKQSGIKGWKLEYGIGANAGNTGNLISNGTFATAVKTNKEIEAEWDTSSLANDEAYTIKLTVWDDAGNEQTASMVWIKAKGSERINAALAIIHKQIFNTPQKPKLQVEYSGNVTNPQLIVNNSDENTSQAAGSKLDFEGVLDMKEGSLLFLYVQGFDSDGNPVYSHDSFQKHISLLDSTAGYTVGSDISLYGGRIALTGEEGTVTTHQETLGGDIKYIDLVVNEHKPENAAIEYYYSVNGGEWKEIYPVSADGGQNYDYDNREFVSGGSGLRFKVVLSGGDEKPYIDMLSADVRYLFYEGGDLIDNDFGKNERGFTLSDNTVNVRTIDETEVDGYVSLVDPTQTGTVYSTLRQVSGDVIAIRLRAETELPEGTSIEYQVSADNGANWQIITPIEEGDESWTELTAAGALLILKATLTGSGGVSPELASWDLQVKAALPGDGYRLQVIPDPPSSLSAFPDASYRTVLRWVPSGTANVTYNVYRSDTAYADWTTMDPLVTGLTECYYEDPNIVYGKQFWYMVTAVLHFEEGNHESLPTNQAFGTVVEEGELDKQLGLQNYWSFIPFETGSGSGYINAANGNLVYSATDMVISDPFFAMAMRRTYNSVATSKSALGYGWDFSFNTVLLREYSMVDGETAETAMILKDGDGSLHRFEKSGNAYTSAKGTLMQLVYDGESGEYRITRKDNITYHFKATDLKLDSFTNLNGAKLSFEYDDRGNVTTVTNTVGDKIEIAYKVQRKTETGFEDVDINDGDYIYVNDHVDMIDTVSWTSQDDSEVRLLYSYAYTDEDKLQSASTDFGADIGLFAESYVYSDVTGHLKFIHTPQKDEDENPLEYLINYTTVSGKYRVSSVTPPIVTEGMQISYADDKTIVSNKHGVALAYTVGTDGTVSKLEKTLSAQDTLTTNYTHNSDLQVTSVSYNNYINGSSSASAVTQEFEYYADGNLKTTSVKHGSALKSKTIYSDYVYNKPRKIEVIDPTNANNKLVTLLEYDSSGNLKKTTDPENGVSTSVYGTLNDTYGYLMSSTDQFGKKISYGYNDRGQLISTVVSDAYTGEVYTRSHVEYDAYGRPKLGYDSDSASNTASSRFNIVEFTYNAQGLLTETEYQNGQTTTAEYSILGQVLASKDIEGIRTEYEFDAMGRPINTRYNTHSANDEFTVSVSYGTWTGGDKVTVTDGMGIVSSEYYDRGGRKVKTDAAGIVTEYTYDLIGNMVTVTDAEGRKALAVYDALNRQVKTTYVSGENNTFIHRLGYTLYGYDASKDISSSVEYDGLGNRVKTTDPGGTATTSAYDKLGRLLSVSQPLSATSTAVTNYTFGTRQNGTITNTVTDAENRRRSETVVDSFGRTLSSSVKEVGGTNSASTSYEYDGRNRLNLVTRADGSREKYHYDAYNRNTKIEYFKSGETQPGMVIEYTYMTGSQRLEYEEVTDETGEVNRLAYSYNADGSIMSYSQSLNSEGGLSVGYTYNKNSQVTSVSYAKPNNAGDYSDGLGEYGRQVIWYEYDPDTGFLLRIYKDQTVTDIEPTAKTANAKLVREYFYKDGGSIDYIKDYIDFNTGSSSFTKLEYEYDGFGRVTALTYRDGGGTIKEKFALEYDDLGNIVKETITEAYSGSETKTKHYAYDLASRLISSTEGGKTTQYTYDKAGNRKSVKVGSAAAQNYEYNYLNQLEEISQGASTPIEFTYDQLGNTTKETVGNKTTNYEYNLLNQLTQLEKKTGNTVNLTEEYSYNPQGQRTARITDHHDVGGTDEFTRFYYMGSALLFTTTEGYLLQTENILDLGGQIIAGKRFENVLYSGKYFFYRYDVRGSVTNILGTDGGVVKNYEYDEFGNTTRGGDGSFKNDVTFTGSISDSASGLQYMNARYYNSSTGRFITQDTYTGSVTEPLTQHLYSYCSNNPINMVDPTGHVDTENDPASVSSGKGSTVVIKPHAKCSICGLNGHNQKNCPEISSGSYDNPNCLACGKNHTSMTCPPDINKDAAVNLIEGVNGFTPNKLYTSMDDMARDVGNDIYDRSKKDGLEYGAVFYQVIIDGKAYYYYSPIKQGWEYGVEKIFWEQIGTEYFPEVSGGRITHVGSIHTHPATNSFSGMDKLLAGTRYLCGTNGTLYKNDNWKNPNYQVARVDGQRRVEDPAETNQPFWEFLGDWINDKIFGG